MSELEPLLGRDPQHASHLSRKLGTFANLAVTYSGVGAAAGIWSLFGFSLGFSGGTMIWGWVIIGLCVGSVCLLWAELASHYPYAGVAYQWSAILGGRRAGWWVGWIYLFGVIWTLTSYYFIVQQVLIPLAGWSGTQQQVIGISLVTLLIATGLNAAGIDILGRLTKYGVIAELGLFVAVSVVVAIKAPHHQAISVVVDRIGTSSGGTAWLASFLAGGLFLAIWVQFSYENGGTLGEETIDAHRKAPRAILGAWAVTWVAGLVFIFVILTAMPNRAAIVKSSTPVQDVITAAVGHTATNLYLMLILFITVLGANAFFAGATRHLFSMARDGVLPGSKWLSKTRASNGAPYRSVLAIAVITAVPFIASRTFTILATGSVAVMYVAYLLMLLVLFRARLRGWPHTTVEGGFSLGRWGMPVTIVALVYTTAMVLDLMWPRPATNPDKFGLPVAWWLLGGPLVVGAIYFFAVIARTRPSEIPTTHALPSTQQVIPAPAE
jgi:amino acid transporter